MQFRRTPLPWLNLVKALQSSFPLPLVNQSPLVE
jgi:hypothetical protein